MSYRLTLIPLDPYSSTSVVDIYSPRVTVPSGDYRILGQIFDFSFRRDTDLEVPELPVVRSEELPLGVQVEMVHDDRAVLVTTNKYGEPFRVTTVGELQKVKLPDDSNPFDRAAIAFILALPNHWRVVLVLG